MECSRTVSTVGDTSDVIYVWLWIHSWLLHVQKPFIIAKLSQHPHSVTWLLESPKSHSWSYLKHSFTCLLSDGIVLCQLQLKKLIIWDRIFMEFSFFLVMAKLKFDAGYIRYSSLLLAVLFCPFFFFKWYKGHFLQGSYALEDNSWDWKLKYSKPKSCYSSFLRKERGMQCPTASLRLSHVTCRTWIFMTHPYMTSVFYLTLLTHSFLAWVKVLHSM